MCTTPSSSAPPPPPPLPLLTPESKFRSNKSHEISEDPSICEWASSELDLRKACITYQICLTRAPFRYKYKHFQYILQEGPTCGLVALSMFVRGEVAPEELLNLSKFLGYSNNGEMLSCKDMAKLAERVLSLAEMENITCTLKKGGLYSQEIIEDLFNGAILLVPYDADYNHSPCLRQGHTAHWALVCGIIIIKNPGDTYMSDPSNIYVLCRHGKSKLVAAWTLDDLYKSNMNLWEFCPKKANDGLLYVQPEGGLGGENGLRDQFLLFKYT
ncbi:UPF0692 protein CG33108 [Papilio machaon]|uniref:UPF0692 protein CG33108 n=1 Tax=Papilio machaon TaxID=76193 RepID=UPI001E66490F|nr:UPF0692 protein CG33108 [Papilio machaon]